MTVPPGVSLNRSITAILLFLLTIFIVTPSPELCGLERNRRQEGVKYLRNYSRKDYDNQSQNWGIVQDRRGIIYSANNGGLMEYDGVAWREISVPNKTVRSLAADGRGTIYVGGVNEIGFLTPGERDASKYTSLTRQLGKEYRNFGYVWRTHVTAEGIYFWTSTFLFRWVDRQVRVWRANGFFDACFVCRGKLYIRRRGEGLLEMRQDRLELIPGAERLADENVYMVAPYSNGRLLLGSRRKGIYLYDGEHLKSFPTEADAYLRQKELYHGIALRGGEYALATRSGGLVVIDARGNLKYIYNKSTGLADNSVKYIFQDIQGNLWLALEEGIAKIEYASAFSMFDESRSDLPGKVLSVTRHGPAGDVIAGTTRGLFRLAFGPLGVTGKFRPFTGISDACWDLVSVGTSLLVAADSGVYLIENNRKNRISAGQAFVLLPGRRDNSRLWVGSGRGLISMYERNGRWQEEHRYESIAREIRTIAQDRDGQLWLGSRTGGVLKVDFVAPFSFSRSTVNRFGTSSGLPPGEVQVFTTAGGVRFGTAAGLFRFDEKNRAFIPDTSLGNGFADGSRNVFRLVEDADRNIWLLSEGKILLARPRPDESYVVDARPFLRVPKTQVNDIYPDPAGGAVWFAGQDGLLRFDTRYRKKYHFNFTTLIRRVQVNGKLLSGGNRRPLVVDYKDRNLAFEFAAPCFKAENQTRYRCFLEGYEIRWSAWDKVSKKEYTNVDAGGYSFRVQARDAYGSTGAEAIFRFKVLPPWYRTWWAFMIYALAFIFLVLLVVRWRSWKLQQEKRILERIIKERTREIQQKSLLLEAQSEKLKEMDQIKSRFFANISHEFRTPLTLIMGPLEQMLSGPAGDADGQKKKLRLMLRSSRRLLNLINQLLELSRFDSGKIGLQASRQNIVSFLKGILHAFDSVADRKDLDLVFRSDDEEIALYFDPEKLEEAIVNLLANAVKFTPAGGEISLDVHLCREEAVAGQAFVEISVADTGPGIPREQRDHIFERFYQVDTSLEHRREGSGIGLAITREIVELHHGTVSVFNRAPHGEAQADEPGRGGTVFLIRLPAGEEHLSDEEVVRESAGHREFSDFPPISHALSMEAEDDEADAGTHEIEEAAGSHGKEIILVVEDSHDMRQYIRSALEPAYTVAEAGDGQEGIERAREIIPDLIISDIMMPGLDGREVCRILKNDKQTSHIPVILLTARASEEDIVEGFGTGADDYITKPFSTRILCARIKNLIDLRRQFQEKIQRRMRLQPVEISISSVDREFLKELQEVIENNVSDPDFNVEELGNKLYMSHATLYRKIHALTGESPTLFIRSIRLRRGAEMLKAGYGNVTEVALEVGFSSPAYFTKCFREKFHQLPSDFMAAAPETS